jgi:hypothetical protein
MEPRFERAHLLAEAVSVASSALAAPIDEVKISDKRIVILAGRERLELSYTYNNAYSQDGSVMPGSGHWSVAIIKMTKAGWFTL